MRIPPNRRKTVRGIGEHDEQTEPSALDDVPPPSSRRGVSCSPPLSRSMSPKPSGRYSMAPVRSDTLEMHAPRALEIPFEEVEAPTSRRPTYRMPSCVAEAAPATDALAKGGAASLMVRRLPLLLTDELTPHDTFVLAFVHDSSSMQSLIDVTTMKETKVAEVLDRLVRMGFVALE
jgi:hypothetical protein